MEEKIVNLDPEILRGTPVFFGLRVLKNLSDYLGTEDRIETF